MQAVTEIPVEFEIAFRLDGYTRDTTDCYYDCKRQQEFIIRQNDKELYSTCCEHHLRDLVLGGGWESCGNL